MGLFKDVVKNLPGGIIGALLKLSIVVEVLIGLATIIAVAMKDHQAFWGGIVSMVTLLVFISFLVVRIPGGDAELADAQADRAKRIAPTPISSPGAAGA